MAKLQYRPLTVEELGTQGQAIAQSIELNPFKLEKTEEGSLVACQDGSSLHPYYVQMSELIDSLNTEEFEQLPVYEDKGCKRVAGILSAKPDGLVHTHHLIKDIVVGYLTSQLTQDGEIGEGEPCAVISGRHRLVALLTAYELSGIRTHQKLFRESFIRVTPKVFDTQTDMLRYIEASNGSRSMSRTEKVNIRIAEKEVDTDDIDSIISHIASGLSNVSDGFRLAFVWMTRHPGVDGVPALPRVLELHTVGQIGSAFGVALKKDQNFKRPLADGQFVAKALMLGFSHLATYLQSPKESNIARSVNTSIVPYVLSKVTKELIGEKNAIDKATRAAERDSKETSVTSPTAESETKPKRGTRKPKATVEPEATSTAEPSLTVIDGGAKTAKHTRKTKETDGVGEKPAVRQRRKASTK